MHSLSVEKTLQRKEFILIEGNVCRYKIFIATGMLRTYRTKDDGSEYILQFSPENSWAVDPESYDNSIPSHCNIEALETTGVIMWAKKDFETLLEQIPALKAFSQKIISANVYLNRQRIFTSLSGTAEEKYNDFICANPDLAARVPLRMIASYLGVSRETLSRIRR